MASPAYSVVIVTSGGNATVIPSNAPLLNQVVESTRFPGLFEAIHQTELREIGAKVWGNRAAIAVAARVVAPRLAGPFPSIALQALPLLTEMFGPENAGLHLRELGEQVQGQGSAQRMRRWRPMGPYVPGGLNPGGFEDWTLEYIASNPGLYQGDFATPELFWKNLVAAGIAPDAFPEFQISLPFSGEYLGQAVTGFNSDPYPPIEGWITAQRFYRWSNPSLGPMRIDEPQQRLLPRPFSRPGLGDGGQAQMRNRRALGRLGLPNTVGGTSNVTTPQQRLIDRFKAGIGLLEGGEPVSPSYRPDREREGTDSLQVWPTLREGPPHQYVRPNPRRVREMKVKIYPFVMLMKMGVNAITETGDFIESIWKSVPPELRRAKLTKSYNRRIDSMLADIWRNIDRVDWKEFQVHYEANQMEDLYYGATSLLATAAGIRLRRGAGGFGMGQALGLHDYAGRPWGQGRRENDPVNWSEVDPVGNAIDAYERWAIDSLRQYRRDRSW